MGRFVFGDLSYEFEAEEDRIAAVKGIREKLEHYVTSHIWRLRFRIVKAWNASGKHQSVLNPSMRKPLMFVNDKERDDFLWECEHALWNCAFLSDAYDKSKEMHLKMILIDDLNGKAWEPCMVIGSGFSLGEGEAIVYCDKWGETLGCWDIDDDRICEEIRDYPKFSGHTVSYWQLKEDYPRIESSRLTAEYTF